MSRAITPHVFKSLDDISDDREQLRIRAKSRLPSLSRMVFEEVRFLAEAMAEWKPYHQLISASWNEFCMTYTGHSAEVIELLCSTADTANTGGAA